MNGARLKELLKNAIAAVPEDDRATLELFEESIATAAPEMVAVWSSEIIDELQCIVPDTPSEGWHHAVHSIIKEIQDDDTEAQDVDKTYLLLSVTERDGITPKPSDHVASELLRHVVKIGHILTDGYPSVIASMTDEDIGLIVTSPVESVFDINGNLAIVTMNTVYTLQPIGFVLSGLDKRSAAIDPETLAQPMEIDIEESFAHSELIGIAPEIEFKGMPMAFVGIPQEGKCKS